MIDLSILPIYLTAVMALLLLPGPDMLLILSSSLSYGRKVGIFASLGNATSGIILTLLATVGVSGLIAMNPIALQVLQLMGSAYLLKMSWNCMKALPSNAPIIGQQSGVAKALYRRALISNLLNPKALLFFILFLPQFVSPQLDISSGQQMLILGLLLNILGLLFNLLLVALIGTLGTSLLKNEKFRTHQHKFMGVIFFILAIWLFTSQLSVSTSG